MGSLNMGQSPLFLFIFVLFSFQYKLQFQCGLKKAEMVCLGFEYRASGWQAQARPRSYSGPLISAIVCLGSSVGKCKKWKKSEYEQKERCRLHLPLCGRKCVSEREKERERERVNGRNHVSTKKYVCVCKYLTDCGKEQQTFIGRW